MKKILLLLLMTAALLTATTTIPERNQEPKKTEAISVPTPSPTTTMEPPPTTTTTTMEPPPTTTTEPPHHHHPPRPPRASRTASATRQPNGSIEACIRRVENGGSYSRGTNPTHFGMYQFSRSTWVANGGDPDTWGSASPEEQDRVFRNTVNRNGYSDWLPYNPC